MKFATLNDGTQDGCLLVVSRDLSHYARADHIAPNLLSALEQWDNILSQLQALYQAVNDRTAEGLSPLEIEKLSAPLPRTWQWLDGAAFRAHIDLSSKAYRVPSPWNDKPLMYQGMSHRFLPPVSDVPFPSAGDDLDLEGEFAIITGPVAAGTTAEDAVQAIRLVTQINDWTLRSQGRSELLLGFGWIQAKPACTMAPVVSTPDELGSGWKECRFNLALNIRRNDELFGRASGSEMTFGFNDLIAHAAYSRDLPPGTVIGSGTVGNADYTSVGSSCILERRGIEILESGEPKTPFLQNNEIVTMCALDENGNAPFGEMRSRIVVTGK